MKEEKTVPAEEAPAVDSEKQAVFEAYNKGTHLIGRIASVVTLVLLLGVPFVIGGYRALPRT